MTPSLKRGAAVSAGLHVAALLALIIVIPFAKPPAPPDETSVEVDFDGDSANAQKSDATGKVAAPAEADTPATDNPALEKPKVQPLETAPPPPPPPPPPPQQDAVVTPPKDIPPPPPQVVTPTIMPMKPPPPQPKVKPPPKPVTPPKLKTLRTQPNETKNPAPDTRSLDNTLDKLLADQKQVKPPTHVYNPERGGARNAGGSKTGNLTGQLSKGQQKTIGEEVRRCYSEDTAAMNYASYSAVITVTIDATGEARLADLSDGDKARANADPAFRAFAERAQRAVLDPTCSKLPVPPDLLGKPVQQLTFRFRP